MSDNLNQQLFSAADHLRGKMAANSYKDYLLGLIFYKYLSDRQLENVIILDGQSLDKYNTPEKQTKYYRTLLASSDGKYVVAGLEDSLGYSIQPDYLFNVMVDTAKQNTFQLATLNKAFINLTTHYDQFNGLFDDIDLTSKRLGADDQQRNISISEVIKKLDVIDVLGHEGDVIGDAYEYLIGEFASEAGQKAGEYYTPHMVSRMMAKIATLGQTDRQSFSVYDPTMGSGSLMLNVRDNLKDPDHVQYHGQELNTTTYNLARMNLILHGVDLDEMHLRNGDTLNKDWPTDEPYTFDAVLMNPPYSAKWSSDKTFLDDPRFNNYGRLAPKGKADFAFLLHGFYHLKDSGTMAIVLPHGVLFRGAAEGTIREKLLRDGSIDAVIGMPSNLFFGTSIPTTVIILKKNRASRDVLFIDASKDFEKAKNQNRLTEENINKIFNAYKDRKDIDKFAHVAPFSELEENEFNMNIPRYVDTFEEEPPVDAAKVQTELIDINKKLAENASELLAMLDDLNVQDESSRALIEATKEALK
ncbi:type I restriction-modification system subunit M [Furfurilactobacillus rossiae]|uniref:site-specific DNA-methyltransferase (adenine-specific) n=1 Tax=Furfurilactobacillus rossiae DSM 15814 TaxID=1114972 RepID=A0A0R1RDJ0_9LACO|nr:type I restriction-modification system subunit M [Furfurilactobacillus rossiae]KRL54494.1 Type I restriction-modification system, M subunit [Furfurilactobacillus rossiae DSM 15814]QFR67389.1 type I restriction-modification system subunit M [Furfurilactobacillus rossiae]QLE60330.1 Type I restriction-modification system DNA-methyltransferase subunit M [Furfurilactobacillus rossiae]